MNARLKSRFSLRTLFLIAAFVAVFLAGRKSHETLPDISQLFRTPPTMVPVAVASTDIPIGATILPSDIKIESWPANKVPRNIVRKSVVSVGVTSKVAIFVGEPISESHVNLPSTE